MKKILSGVLAVSMLITTGTFAEVANGGIAITANAIEENVFDGMKYEIMPSENSIDDYVIIKGFIQSTAVKEIIIPSHINDLPVRVIDDYAFAGISSLKKLVLPEGIKIIGMSAFERCTQLTDIEFPTTLSSIEANAFGSCLSLKQVNLPDTPINIERGAFADCTGLEEISFPNCYIIPEGVCYNCISLKKVNIGHGTSEIESNAFMDCISLKEVYFSIGVNHIAGFEQNESMAFANCQELTDIYYEGNVLQWEQIKGFDFVTTNSVHFGATELPKALNPDVNCDGVIDASDASVILSYYAYQQTGGKGSLEDFLNN